MITVASYNIRKSVGLDWRRRPERILHVLGEMDADIIALQEVDRRFGSRVSSLSAEVIAEETPYRIVRFAERPQSLGWHGNALLVRKPLRVLSQQALVLPSLEPRGAVMADIDIEHCRLRIVGLHLGLMGRWRQKQAEAVLSQLHALEDRMPTVIMGDLNEWKAEGPTLRRFAHDHHVIDPGPSFHASRPTFSFDRIITSRDLRVEDKGVHTSDFARRASDHLPVWARLSLLGD